MKIIIKKNCFVQGEMKKEGDEVEVDEQTANELVRAGKAEDTVELDLINGEKTLEEMDINELAEHGSKLGVIDVDNLRNELIQTIQAEDDEDETDINKMDKSELLECAEKMGLEVTEKMNMKTIIEKIEDARANS